MKVKNITIVGGGTAGLISALILEKKFRNHINIQIIKSDEIGIIGVGEGSTEHWIDFMGWCDLDYFELIRECNCTLKCGIMFKDWSDNNFLHSVYGGINKLGQENIFYLKKIANNKKANDFVFPLFLKNKVVANEPRPTNQFHFDTYKLNEYLIKKCKERNVKIINDKIKEVKINKNGINYIKGTVKYKSDFYIDCTGFRRILISKFKHRWVKLNKYLKVKSAIVFQTKDTNNYNIYTTAKAMKSGWLFNIPVWGRHGNGYIFDSDLINSDQAKKEVEKYLKHKIDVRKQINFESGYLDKVWIKNCFAVGLSANFVEPLEATSIGTSIQQSYLLSHYLINYDDKIINHVNNLVEKIMLNIRDFICLHYITKRKEEFWKTQVIPDTLKYKLDLFKNRLPIQEDFNNGCKYQLFWDKNYIHIMQGLNLINKQKIKKQYELLNDDVKNYISDFNIQANNIITHKQYLTNIRNEL